MIKGVLLVDKPEGLTSMRTVDRVKRALGIKKAGHTGTLDPIATGVLAICLGQATRIAEYLLASHKGYEAELMLGVTTNTLDADGEVEETRPLPDEATLTPDALEPVLDQFRGPISQVPPAFSALKVNGRRAHALARAGEEVKLDPREVEVLSLTLTQCEPPQLAFSCEVSKGTYIRSLIRDLGEALGCGAHMTALRRTSVGPFLIQDTLTLEAIQEEPALAYERIIPMAEALHFMPRLALEPYEVGRLQNGLLVHRTKEIEPSGEGPHCVVDEEGELVALVEHKGGKWKIIRVFAAA